MEVEQVAHISTDENSLIRTAMIPFCEFGGNMSVMGVKIDQLEVPVCKSFRPKIVMDQLCYSVDPNEFRKYLNDNGEKGISLYINFNEDRQFSSMEEVSQNDPQYLILETIGK